MYTRQSHGVFFQPFSVTSFQLPAHGDKVEFQHFAAQPGLERVSPEQRRWQAEYPIDAKMTQERVESAHKQALEAESKQEHLKRLQLWESASTVSLAYPRLQSTATTATTATSGATGALGATMGFNMSSNSNMM
jgi:hypothetical protein